MQDGLTRNKQLFSWLCYEVPGGYNAPLGLLLCSFCTGIGLLVFTGRGGPLPRLRGAEPAGVALCYGNNNGGACAAGSARPLAPDVAPSSPRLFSRPARLSNKPSRPPLLLLIHSLAPASVSPTTSFSSSPSLPLPSYSCLLQPLLSVSGLSFCATMRAIQPKSPPNMPILPRNAIAGWTSPLRFAPAPLSAELLCISRSLRGHCFPSQQCGRGLDVGVEGKLLAPCPAGENSERGRSAKKGPDGAS